MRKSKNLVELATIIAVGGCLSVTSATAEPERREPVCRGGILTDAVTGTPLLDRERHPLRCGAPVVEGDTWGGYVLASVVGAGVLGVGICAAAGCFDSNNQPFYPFIPGRQGSP